MKSPANMIFLDLKENRIITVWSKRNQYRLDPYHRLDISVTIDSKPFKEVFNKETNKSERIEKKVVSSWNISVYNLYNRANPYFIFFDYSGDPLEGTAEFGASQVSLFPILPSITWNFKF